MVEKLQRRFALSRKGAVDTIKGSLLCALQNISFMLPVYMLYCLVSDMLGGALTASRIPFYAAGTVICAAVILVCTYLQYNSTFLATYIETGVRRIGLAEKLRRIPLSFFGKKDLADLTSAIMNDCAVLETSQSHHICPLIGAIISTTLIALSLFIFNWRMALTSVWVLPVAFGLAAGVQKKLSAKSMAARLSCEDGIQECMESMPDLRANNAERRYLDGLNKKLRAFEGRLTKSELGTAVFVVTASLMLRLGIATTALVGSYLLVAGELDIITFFMFLLVVSRLYDPLEGSLQNLAAIISTSTNIKRMNEILDHPVQEGEDKLTNDGCDIVFDHVTFGYDSNRNVLQDMSFTIPAGKTVAILGATGSGKSSIVHLMQRLFEPQSGRITIGGVDIQKIDRSYLRAHVGLVLQEPFLYSKTLRDNVGIAVSHPSQQAIERAAVDASALSFIEDSENGWNTVVGERGVTLSGGQKQRIAIARTLMKDNDILIFDDSLSAVDTETDAAIRHALKEHSRDTTTIIISHRVVTLSQADLILVVEDGHIIQQGTHQQLIHQPGLYARIFNIQTALEEEFARHSAQEVN
mgnify:CR=1 FL=1